MADRGCPQRVGKESGSLNSTAFPLSCCWSLIKPPNLSEPHLPGQKNMNQHYPVLPMPFFIFCIFNDSSSWGLADPGVTTPPRAGQFLGTVKGFPGNMLLTCKPIDLHCVHPTSSSLKASHSRPLCPALFTPRPSTR